ncbi:YbaK/EbsC family protein [Cytobacillus oceanisediminis]|uniref:YbaK/EbsC family protein n=2 Tax=Niallia TaxID=2837506 RepID=A0A941GDI5_NIACI|nr:MULTISPECIES: YbaK/EbsC family protein [Bacillaceae]EOR21564.1 YbaK/prolyl-tRNA synthetase associated domain-containing protein [Niallia nealsonii AAU1]MDU1847954.1 YbaK/EbsC family protein [Niallia nealsonii]MBZ9535831.1 YbaK/EbsC family protein [Cytobacillus oceanisediminis]MCB5238493.1 YbaK/EbsC family protein [Niallia circulans]MED3795274.1 YbaK/EbsC family protein [Niallia alba]
MSLENVQTYLSKWNREKDIQIFETSSATVLEAANTLGVEPKRIAKTLSFRKEDDAILIVAAGDAKIDNKKFKQTFTEKPRMLSPEEVLEKTGHAVGGVCPFGLTEDLPVYMDESLKRFTTVFPACGSSNSAIELTNEELYIYGNVVEWVNVCKGWE